MATRIILREQAIRRTRQSSPLLRGTEGEYLTKEEENSWKRWIEYIAPGLRVILQRLAALRQGEEVDDYGVAKPTEYAYETICNLVVGVSSQLSGNFPRGSASTDSEGGIRVEWIYLEREVKLIVPAHEGGRMYIYHEAGDEYAVEANVSVANLARWLNRLTEA